MKAKRILAAIGPVVLIAAAAAHDAAAQQAQTFEVRLAATPRDRSMREVVAGAGSVEATLAGNELTVTGRFNGLKSPATRAHIHIGPVTGVRGPAVYELDVTKAAAGTIAGVVELSDDSLVWLEAGRLYVQLDSVGAPEGNLWGWLLWKD